MGAYHWHAEKAGVLLVLVLDLKWNDLRTGKSLGRNFCINGWRLPLVCAKKSRDGQIVT